MLESRILPFFGHYKLNKITPIDIMRFYDLLEKDTQIIRKKNNNGKITKKPLSPKTILEHHKLIRAMLHKAVYWQLITHNPTERVQPPKTQKPKRDCYDEEQTRILVDNLEKLTGNDIKYRVAILLDIFTGARLGHAQITTTYNFYVHPFKLHDKTAGRVLESLLLPSKVS